MNNHPLSGALDVWEGVVDDMAVTAEEYREAGWETLELHPGDVTTLPAVEERKDGPFGLDVLVPGDEFAEVSALVEDTEFDEFDAYRAQQGGLVFAVLVMKSSATKQAVLCPLYYRIEDAQLMLDRVREERRLFTYVRPLSDEERVTFTQKDPDPLLPESE